jgi:hypothetical protein
MTARWVSALTRMLRPRRTTSVPPPPAAGRDRAAPTATVRVPPPSASALTITYAPDADGDPDAGEIVWTWVPFEEDDGRGKDRPVLVIGRQSDDRVYALRLTSKPHVRDRDYLPLGAGEWDLEHRPSWLDLELLYSVHARGMRREAAALDRARFEKVASALRERYGWRFADG